VSIQLTSGSLEAVFDAPASDPALAGATLFYGGTPVGTATIRDHSLGAVLTCAVPASVISDGIQTLILASADGQTLLASTTLIAGMPERDQRAETDLLRGELELVKQALRRLARQ
jgi:hypothetical protein